MIKSFYPHLFLLVLVSIFLLLLTIVNGNENDHSIETKFFDKRFATTAERFNDLSEDNSNDEDANIAIRDLFIPYPNRRSSFYAMRGKRRII